jgi:hypothetical protein
VTFSRPTAFAPVAPSIANRVRLGQFLLTSASVAAIVALPAHAEAFDPYPVPALTNDFGGVGLLQNPTARFARDGQFTAGFNEVAPYTRYFVTMQAMPWMEATLRYTSVSDRLYSEVPDFSGDQTYKDRGFDVKFRLLTEGRIRPALAIGARDFLGTGLFSSEYIVASKSFGPLDATLGMAWGNMSTRDHIRNPLTYISDSFARRGGFDGGTGGNFSNVYFRGPRAAFFGGVQYSTPIRGLTLKAEYDANSYQREALGNNQPVKSAINIGADYRILPWLHAQASFERGNRFGLTVTATTNFHRQTMPPKYDLPAAPVGLDAYPVPDKTPVDLDKRLSAPGAIGMAMQSRQQNPLNAKPSESVIPGPGDLKTRLVSALDYQGTALYAADFKPTSVDLFVAQTRFNNVATGIGRIARSAFAVLPAEFETVTVILVENGVETLAVKVPRAGLMEAVKDRRGPSVDKLLTNVAITEAPLTLGQASFKGPVNNVYPQFLYSVRPGLKTTLGRPEQFILYQAYVGLNGGALLARGWGASGQFTVNISNNFDKLRIPTDSTLPPVRSNIAEYLREGTTAISHLQMDYNFNIAPSLYGHVYGGLLEEMFAGVGGEMLYRPATANWAIGADLSYVRQRDFNQFFGMQDYTVLTGFVTGYLHFPKARIDASARVGRYLAKDFGVTFDVARTFESGVRVGAFATFTNVSAEDFGEGSFDKGIYLTIPLDLLYTKHVRGSIGVLYRPLIRDGGQQLFIRQPLIYTTEIARKANLMYNWSGITN